MHKLWELGTGGEYFKLYKILREFPHKFREYNRMNIKTFHYILDSVKDDLQGYSNLRKFFKSRRETFCCPSVRTSCCGKDKHKLHMHNDE